MLKLHFIAKAFPTYLEPGHITRQKKQAAHRGDGQPGSLSNPVAAKTYSSIAGTCMPEPCPVFIIQKRTRPEAGLWEPGWPVSVLRAL